MRDEPVPLSTTRCAGAPERAGERGIEVLCAQFRPIPQSDSPHPDPLPEGEGDFLNGPSSFVFRCRRGGADAAPALSKESHREALAGATDPVVAEPGKLYASAQGGEGGGQFPQTSRQRWSSSNGLIRWVQCLLYADLRCGNCFKASINRCIAPARGLFTSTMSPGKTTWDRNRMASSIVSQGTARSRLSPVERAPPMT